MDNDIVQKSVSMMNDRCTMLCMMWGGWMVYGNGRQITKLSCEGIVQTPNLVEIAVHGALPAPS